MGRNCKLLSHVVLVCKYRKSLLKKELDEEVKLLIREISSRKDFIVEEMESDENHIHILISHPPTISLSSIIRIIKSYSTYHLWRKFPGQLKKYFWKEKTFWSDGYFIKSTGEASESTTRFYIKNQKNHSWNNSSPKLKTSRFSC